MYSGELQFFILMLQGNCKPFHLHVNGFKYIFCFSAALTWTACFGLLPVGSPVYWAAYSMSSKTNKVSQVRLEHLLCFGSDLSLDHILYRAVWTAVVNVILVFFFVLLEV